MGVAAVTGGSWHPDSCCFQCLRSFDHILPSFHFIASMKTSSFLHFSRHQWGVQLCVQYSFLDFYDKRRQDRKIKLKHLSQKSIFLNPSFVPQYNELTDHLTSLVLWALFPLLEFIFTGIWVFFPFLCPRLQPLTPKSQRKPKFYNHQNNSRRQLFHRHLSPSLSKALAPLKTLLLAFI